MKATLERCNISMRLRRMAEIIPYKRAVVFPHGRDKEGRIAYTHLTFQQLDQESDAYARGFLRAGIQRESLVLLLVRPSLEFFAIVFALFKIGAIPILIDPGMGLRRLLECIAHIQPEIMIAIPRAQGLRLLFPTPFRSLKKVIVVGARWFPGAIPLSRLRDFDPTPFPILETSPDDRAAILFTSGSTGPAKGVIYEHGMFDAQCEIIRTTYEISTDDIDLPTFPLFALFSVGLGMTAVIPEMDPTRPAHVDPRRIIEAIKNQGCTFSFGSPALWRRVATYCKEHQITLPSLRKVLIAGAPVPIEIHDDLLHHVLSRGAETHTPYGATESLPLTDMKGSAILSETCQRTKNGEGICVGRPIQGARVAVIRKTNETIERWDPSLLLPQGEIGEIIAQGPHVTKAYAALPEATRAAKIREGDKIWHRLGDLGYFDEKGRLWFCGRKSHCVETQKGPLYSVCCEAVFNQHPAVLRSALVGLSEGDYQKPVMVIERKKEGGHTLIPDDKLCKELQTLAEKNPLTRTIQHIVIYPHSFPVDIRHNAKIDREALARWVTKKMFHVKQ